MLSCAHFLHFQARAPYIASITIARFTVPRFAREFTRDFLPVMSADALSPQASDEMIERCLNGDQAAWEAIVRLYRRKVFNVAYKFVGRHDQAEDLTQDVFLKLYKSLDTFDRRANFQTWLISVSRNLCIDHYRAVRKERETINRDVDPADYSPVSSDTRADTQLEQRDRVKLLRRALDKLAPTLRTAVMLRDIQELTYQEIADRLHLPEGTVKSRINRGRTELARQIQRLREEQDAVPKTGVSG
jgi:RNA polymerase sigma factor (sigma-70 family)